MSISNQDDYISGSEVASEIARLKDELDEKTDERDEALAAEESTEQLEEELDDIAVELKPLVELEEDIYFFDLNDINLISENAWQDYCERFAIDCGDISENSSVYAYVDWERYADGIQVDYTSVEFDGETYYHRS